MEEGTGELLIRDAEDSYPLESPTTFTGAIDTGAGGTGAITGASFSTPDISFEVPVLNGALTADVEAHFAEVAPGTSTGSVNFAGDVVLRTSLRVDLHIVIPAAAVDATCSSSPVALELFSTAPYDESTDKVTVADPDFSIPAFPTTTNCPSLVTDNLNPLLSGPGHTASLTLLGDIELPPEPGAESTTTLTATPGGGARFGNEVTLSAAIAASPGEDTSAVATGTVRFSVDGDPLGTVALTDGVAELTTSTLNAGTRTLTAEFSGDAEYQPSENEISYIVAAVPAVDVTRPTRVVIDAAPESLPLSVENPALAVPVENAAVDITFTRPDGGFLRPGMLVLERRVEGDTWEEVPLVAGAQTFTMNGRIGPETGRSLPAPGSLIDDLRLSAKPQSSGGQTTPLGNVVARFDVNEVDPGTGAVVDTLATTEGTILVAKVGRGPTSLVYDESFGGPAISPPIVRAGNAITVNTWSLDYGGGSIGGSVSVQVDGLPTAFWHSGLATDAPRVLSAPVGSLGAVPEMVIDTPPTTVSGTHTVTVTYSGDSLFQPTSLSVPFAVVPQRDPLYDCVLDTTPSHVFRAQVRGFARLPAAVPSGTVVPLRDLDVEFVTDRSVRLASPISGIIDEAPTAVGTSIDAIEFGFGDATGTATSATRRNIYLVDPSDTDPDMGFTFDGESASVTVAGAPGEEVSIELDRVHLTGRNFFGSVIDLSCVPTTDAVELGTVTVAGTTLAVEAPQPTRADDRVVLRARVAPSTAVGSVEFIDDGTVVAIAPIVAGQAVATITLAEGTNVLTARSRAGASAPSTTSVPVEVEVLLAVDCAAFAETGHGAVVRLVYMELLGRCPDQAGYDYWVGRLDGGTSVEVFARSIARTPEAVGRVVDDAYATMLGRAPDAEGRAFWVGRLRASGRYDQLLGDLAASGEFWSLAGSTDEGFVTRVYQRLLNRAPDAGGLDHWVGRLEAGMSRRVLVLTLARLDEPLGRLVDAAYHEIVSRIPNAVERLHGIEILRATGDRSGLYAELIGRPEFTTRAQGFPNPED